MGRSVWKFPLIADHAQRGEIKIEMPLASKVIALQVQEGVPMLWAEVILEIPQKLETRTFAVHGTGHSIPWDRDYVGTWQEPPYVWHLYEVRP